MRCIELALMFSNVSLGIDNFVVSHSARDSYYTNVPFAAHDFKNTFGWGWGWGWGSRFHKIIGQEYNNTLFSK